MSDSSILAFLDKLRGTYGKDRVLPCSSNFEDAEVEHGVSFRLQGVDARFSVITFDGSLPHGHYSVQIESEPPGEAIYVNDDLEADELLLLIDRVANGEWPSDQ
jgi:hypothetical protein